MEGISSLSTQNRSGMQTLARILTNYAQKTPRSLFFNSSACLIRSTLHAPSVIVGKGVSYIDCHSHRNDPTCWVDTFNDGGCPLPFGNMQPLDATCSHNTVAPNFHCQLKTSVTRFPLPLKIQWHSISVDARNALCRNLTESYCNWHTHSAHLKTIASLFNSQITNGTGTSARDTQTEKKM
jgi:hypothetical protein